MRWFFYRVQRSFDVLLPPSGASTVGQFVEFVAKERGTAPDTLIVIRHYPSLSEVRDEAFRRFQKAIANIGGHPPTSMESPLDSVSWLPLPNPSEKWQQVAKQLKCDFPLLWPGKGFALVFWVGYALMIGVWVGLLYAFGFNQDPTTLWDWIAGGCFMLFMFVASFLIPLAIAEWSSTRQHVPFESLADLVDCIRQTVDSPMEDSLSRPIQSTIRDYIQDILSEELGILRSEVGPEFSLIPDHLWEMLSERGSGSGT